MKRVKEIAASGYRTSRTNGKTICTDDKTRLYRWVNSFVQMSKTVRTDGGNGFTQWISPFHTTDFIISHNGFRRFTQRISRHPVADFTATSCEFHGNQLRFYS